MSVEPTRSPSVLVVEDDDSLRLLARTVLEGVGCTVRTAATGRRGLRMAQFDVPDVIVLDVGLPGMDGGQVARALRREPRTADVGIVVTTGSITDAEVAGLRTIGLSTVLRKPYDITELADAVLAAAAMTDVETAASV